MLTLRLTTVALTAFVVSATACASSGSSGTAAKRTEGSPDRLTSTELINATGSVTAFDAISRLRPRWLKPVSSTGSIGSGISAPQLVVYLDGNRLGGIDALKTLSLSSIKSMQLLDAARAATLLREVGTEPIAGAIVIISN